MAEDGIPGLQVLLPEPVVHPTHHARGDEEQRQRGLQHGLDGADELLGLGLGTFLQKAQALPIQGVAAGCWVEGHKERRRSTSRAQPEKEGQPPPLISIRARMLIWAILTLLEFSYKKR